MNFSPSVVAHAVFSYARYRSPIGLDLLPDLPEYGSFPGLVDFRTYAFTGNVAWTITKGLSLTVEASYEKRDYKDGFSAYDFALDDFVLVDPDYDVFAGGIRLKRSF